MKAKDLIRPFVVLGFVFYLFWIRVIVMMIDCIPTFIKDLARRQIPRRDFYFALAYALMGVAMIGSWMVMRGTSAPLCCGSIIIWIGTAVYYEKSEKPSLFYDRMFKEGCGDC